MERPERPGRRRAHASQEPLRSAYSSDPEMRELVDFFVGDLECRVANLRRALDEMDIAGLRRLAHQLSGAAAGYGFAPIGDAAKELESELLAKGTSAGEGGPDGLEEEMEISALREKAEDLIATCRRAIPMPEPLPFEQNADGASEGEEGA